MSTPAFKITSKKPPVDPAKLAAFGNGADAPAGQGSEAPDFASMDHKRRVARFSMRLTDREAAQLQHLADTTPDSMHEFCLKAVQKALAEKFPTPAQT